ncbi:homoserine dehydrogenase [Pontibacter roseus]|uniref:homoserine dehydrogenase n=1 Tax=Pontibacter roseus TaxID=336989 RepID=UPI00037DC8E2|nr:homoserine dehydrogenase [Pontibacter roseus]
MKIQKFKKRIGIIGFGCVGQGLYDVVAANPHLGLEVGRICVKDKEKPRTLPHAAFTFDVQEVLQDKSLDILAELISDPEEALHIVRQALQQGQTIVSANKKMIAENLPELIQLQQRHGGVLLYEASVCGSIPIIRTLEGYYGSEPLLEVRGILNGSSNYILSKLHNGVGSYADALQQAQKLGFAEADPSLDVDGIDALHKLCIITAHAFGLLVHPDEVLHFGIGNITREAVELAASLDASVKLVATTQTDEAGNISLHVLPTLVPAQEELHAVHDEFNGVEIEAQFAGRQLLKGRGAGSHPTGSAVWADITSAVRGYRYTYPKLCVTDARAALSTTPVTLLLQGESARLEQLVATLRPTEVHQPAVTGQAVITTLLQHLKQHQALFKEKQVFVAQIPDAVPLEKVLMRLYAPVVALVP